MWESQKTATTSLNQVFVATIRFCPYQVDIESQGPQYTRLCFREQLPQTMLLIETSLVAHIIFNAEDAIYAFDRVKDPNGRYDTLSCKPT